MSYNNPTKSECYKSDTKRQSLYHYIRNASKMMKMRTEIRKHRTLPNDSSFAPTLNEKCSIDMTAHYYNEKTQDDSIQPNHKPNSILPIFPTENPLSEKPTEDNEFDLTSEDEDLNDEVEYLLDHDEEILSESDCYTMTLKKLYGIQEKHKTNTAVLITLSSCALAAANAARQKRQKSKMIK